MKGLLAADRPESRDAEVDMINVCAAMMCLAGSKVLALRLFKRCLIL